MDTQSKIFAEETLDGVIQEDSVIGGQIQIQGTILGVVDEEQQQDGTIEIEHSITGIVQEEGILRGTISNNNIIAGTINYQQDESGGDLPIYDGDYTVTPKIHEQSLATRHKTMRADVIIKAIPYFETSNLSGKTVYIGGDN